VVDVSDCVETNFEAIQCEARAAVFGPGKVFRDQYEIWTRFWGMRHGVEFAEPVWHAHGSMATMYPARKMKLRPELPVLDL
jgi:hypothetical protein